LVLVDESFVPEPDVFDVPLLVPYRHQCRLHALESKLHINGMFGNRTKGHSKVNILPERVAPEYKWYRVWYEKYDPESATHTKYVSLQTKETFFPYVNPTARVLLTRA